MLTSLRGSSALLAQSNDTLTLPAQATISTGNLESSFLNRATRAVKGIAAFTLLLAAPAAAGAAAAGFYNSREQSPIANLLGGINWPQVGNMPPDFPRGLIMQGDEILRQNDELRNLASKSMRGLAVVDDAGLGRRSQRFADLNFYDLRGLFELLKASTNVIDYVEPIAEWVRKVLGNVEVGAIIAPQLSLDPYDEKNAVSLAELAGNLEAGSAQFFNPPEDPNLPLTIPGIAQPLMPVISNATDLLEAMGWVGRDLIPELNGTQVASAYRQIAAKLDGASSNDSYIAPQAIEWFYNQRMANILNALVGSVRTYGALVAPRNEGAFRNNTAEIAEILTKQDKAGSELQAQIAAFKADGASLLDQQNQQRHIGIAGASVAASLIMLAVLSKYAPALYRQAYTALGLAPQAEDGLRQRLMPAESSRDAAAMLAFVSQIADAAAQDPEILDQVQQIARRVREQPVGNSAPDNAAGNLRRATLTEIPDDIPIVATNGPAIL